jgi:hypothetical protein
MRWAELAGMKGDDEIREPLTRVCADATCGDEGARKVQGRWYCAAHAEEVRQEREDEWR